MAAGYRNPRGGALGHAVGMEVHDVGGADATVLAVAKWAQAVLL
jgi:hypothetical protein